MTKDEIIGKLWDIIDNIDTASDIAKEDDKLYRAIVEKEQAKRWSFGIKTDGYRLIIPD